MAAQDNNLSSEGSRRNGWSLPLHLLQVCGWIAVLYFMFVYFSTMVAALPQNWQPAAYVVNVLVSICLVFTMLTATTINPADPAVLEKTVACVTHLDRSKYPHAILNQHCYLCEVNVGEKSKHCRACNKCVAEFDHHCKWLNNCVGGRNYRWFISSLISGAIGTLIIVTVGLLEFIGYFVDKESKDILLPYIILKEEGRGNESAQFYIVHQPVSPEGWITITGITTLLAVITLLLLTHLLSFHIWLWCKGLTTYEYIVRLRENESYQDTERHKQMTTTNSTRPTSLEERKERSGRNANKVTPSKSSTNKPSGSPLQIRRQKSVEEYGKALERPDLVERGETPPPLSSPIHPGTEYMGNGMTAVKKLKKRKKKQRSTETQQEADTQMKKKKRSSAATQQQVSTIGDSTLYCHSENKQASPKSASQASRQSRRQKSHRDNPPYDSQSEESLMQVATEPRSKKCKRHDEYAGMQLSETFDGSENIDLNSTCMFTVNSSARLFEDGSLDYSGKNAFRTLPLTPVMLRRDPKVPPLDLTQLKSSSDSVVSSVNFKPYSATVRSSDTYRPSERLHYQNLGLLPENTGDMHV